MIVILVTLWCSLLLLLFTQRIKVDVCQMSTNQFPQSKLRRRHHQLIIMTNNQHGRIPQEKSHNWSWHSGPFPGHSPLKWPDRQFDNFAGNDCLLFLPGFQHRGAAVQSDQVCFWQTPASIHLTTYYLVLLSTSILLLTTLYYLVLPS